MNPEARNLFNSIISDPKLLPLSSFKSNKFSKYNLFPQAHSLPPFFENNLQSEGRVVKYLKGPEGPLRAFYYQLFKLGFQIENQKDFASIIKNTIFDPHLNSSSTGPSSGKQYNLTQYKRIIAEYIKMLQQQVIPTAQLTFNQYPIIDQAMLAILQLILEKVVGEVYGKSKINSLFQLLTQLCHVFGITLEVYDSCYSFAQADVFLYVEGRDSCYLAFLSQMAEVESHQKTSQSQSFKQQSSSSYIDSKQQTRQGYKDIRLSAGNRGARARPLNRSVPGGKSIYGTSSFGESQTRSRRTLERDEKHIQEKQEKEEDREEKQKQEKREKREQREQKEQKEQRELREQREAKDFEQDQFEIYENGNNNGLEKNVFESSSFDGDEETRKSNNGCYKSMNSPRNKLESIIQAQKIEAIQSRQIIKNISEQDQQGSYNSICSAPQANQQTPHYPTPEPSVQPSPNEQSPATRIGAEQQAPKRSQEEKPKQKQVSSIYDVKTYKTITDSDLFDRKNHQNIFWCGNHEDIEEQVKREYHETKKAIKQKIQMQYQLLSMKKKSKVKIAGQIFQYQFKSEKYKKYKEDTKLSNIVDKMIDKSLIAKGESSHNINPKKQDKIDISTSKPSSTQTKQISFAAQHNFIEKQYAPEKKKEQQQTNLQIPLIGSPMKTSSNVRTQPSRHVAPSSTEILFDQFNPIQSPTSSRNPTIFTSQTPPSPPRNAHNNDVNFYTPKPASLSLNIDALNLLKKSEKKYNGIQNYARSNDANQETLGTFYREFTDTKVMEVMVEPFKTKVKTTRQKFKGVRSKNFKGFF